MPRQCEFPIQFSDNRRCYRAGATPGFTLSLALVAALSGYAGFSHAAPFEMPVVTRTNSATNSSSRSVDLSLPFSSKAVSALGTLT